MMVDFDSVQDSGEREEFPTGSVRDTSEGKGRFDLIPRYCITRLARHYENGARKYSEENWKLGQPLRRYMDSAIRHCYAALDGDESEDHLAAIAWNAFSFMWTQMMIRKGLLPESLDNLPKDYQGEQDGSCE